MNHLLFVETRTSNNILKWLDLFKIKTKTYCGIYGEIEMDIQ